MIGLVSIIFFVAPMTTASVANGSDSLAITGYIEQGSSPGFINRSAQSLTTVGVDGINLTTIGDDVSTPDNSMLSLLARAHAENLRGELLIGNFDDAIGDFSPRIAADLLLNPSNIQRVALHLSSIVAAQGWDGVTVDLESLSSLDHTGLVNFVTELRHDLPTNCTLSIDVMASTSLSDYVAGGYDLAQLGQIVDRVVLMTYDQHGPWSQPGPIGALNWQTQALKVLLTQVSPAKVDLGVAGYGYTWPAGAAMHRGISLSDAQARSWARKNATNAIWNGASGEWTAKLRNGTVLWWSDARSYRLRLLLAQRYHLHGVALWQLATSDPLN